MRDCFELLGGIVHWDAETETVTSTVGTHIVVHRPGTAEATLDGEVVTLRAAAARTIYMVLP